MASKKQLTPAQIEKLRWAKQYCDDNDKSTEFMLQYMQDVANVGLTKVLKFLEQLAEDQKHIAQAEKEYAEDMNHLEWIYNRMVEVHKENPNYDYMLRFKKIVDILKSD